MLILYCVGFIGFSMFVVAGVFHGFGFVVCFVICLSNRHGFVHLVACVAFWFAG